VSCCSSTRYGLCGRDLSYRGGIYDERRRLTLVSIPHSANPDLPGEIRTS
jgi:hypothetical protein